MAYRTADYVRHQQLDFVVGIEVHLSGNHTLNGKPFEDICDDLKGKYPKDFKFTGWHPLCRCYTTTILKTPEEMAEDDRRIMEGEEPMPSSESRNFVPDVPEGFEKWIDDNRERIERAKSLPYFMRDNEKYIKPLTITPQARAGADEAQKFNEEMMQVADVPQAPKTNLTDNAVIPLKKNDLEKWYKENLPETKNGKRFVVKSSDATETIINRRFYEECISKYKNDELYNLKLGYAAKSHLLFPQSTFVRNERTEHYKNTVFKVYEIEIDSYILEFKCKVDYNGCFLHILRLKKKDGNP